MIISCLRAALGTVFASIFLGASGSQNQRLAEALALRDGVSQRQRLAE